MFEMVLSNPKIKAEEVQREYGSASHESRTVVSSHDSWTLDGLQSYHWDWACKHVDIYTDMCVCVLGYVKVGKYTYSCICMHSVIMCCWPHVLVYRCACAYLRAYWCKLAYLNGNRYWPVAGSATVGSDDPMGYQECSNHVCMYTRDSYLCLLIFVCK